MKYKKDESQQNGKIAKSLFWSFTILINVISYFAELRPLIATSFGTYWSGMIDGIIITIIVLSVIFYRASIQ